MRIKATVMRDGYIHWVDIWDIRQGELHFMFGDHGWFCPIGYGGLN